MIENCKLDNISECFKTWKNAKQIIESDEKPEDVFYVSIDNVKVRDINPLVKLANESKRIMDISEKENKTFTDTFSLIFQRF